MCLFIFFFENLGKLIPDLVIYEEPVLVFLVPWSYFKLHFPKNVNGKRCFIGLPEGKIRLQHKWTENTCNFHSSVSIQNCSRYSFFSVQSTCGCKSSPTRTARSLRLCSRTSLMLFPSSGFTEKPCLKTFMVESELKFYGGTDGVCRGTGREKSEEGMRFRSGAIHLSSAVAGGLNSYSLENFSSFLSFIKSLLSSW